MYNYVDNNNENHGCFFQVDRKEKQLQVCIDCASILLENDIVERVKAHFEGKQHTGYVLIRETYEKLKVCCMGVTR